MKWNFSLKNKLITAGALSSLCLLVLISNYIDRNHTQNVKNSISTLYEDRLVAESYILKLTTGVYEIKEAINSHASDSAKADMIDQHFLAIKDICDEYLKTRFTTPEKTKTDQLLNLFRELENTPSKDLSSGLKIADKAVELLHGLSAIQLEESEKIMDYAEKLYLSGKTSSQFVFAVIIVILLVLLTIVFSVKTLIPKDRSNPHLN